MADSASGETVSHTYDALKRLTGATSVSGGTTAWTQTFGYDGFGNMTSKSLNGGANSAPAVDPTTNRLTSGYDANGNMLTGYGLSMTYDERNRVASASPTSGGTEYYGYAPDNKRIYRWNPTTGTEEWTFYGARGERIGSFGLNTSGTYYFSATQTNLWFAGQLISNANGFVFRDRLGSDREAGAEYYPYGDEITSTANGTEKYGTYFRDSFTTLDYADQRYYASSYGRFNTADQYMASAGPSDPGSWNRYAYVGGDPINKVDPQGLLEYDAAECFDDPDECESNDGSGVGGPGYFYNAAGDAFPNPAMTFRLDRANLIHAGGMLLARQSISPKCEGGMEALGADFDILAVYASIVNIVNGTTDQQSIASAYGDPTTGAAAEAYFSKKYNTPNITVEGYFAATGNTAAWTPPGGNTVYINPALIDTSNAAADEGLMLHEMLHEVYGEDDQDIMKILAKYDPGAGINPKGPSSQISVWMTNNCVNGKGNQ